jgi:hypothetical protein
MTGADGGADPDARPRWQWDVALSFAGVRRDYVEQVAQALQARGMRRFSLPTLAQGRPDHALLIGPGGS